MSNELSSTALSLAAESPWRVALRSREAGHLGNTLTTRRHRPAAFWNFTTQRRTTCPELLLAPQRSLAASDPRLQEASCLHGPIPVPARCTSLDLSTCCSTTSRSGLMGAVAGATRAGRGAQEFLAPGSAMICQAALRRREPKLRRHPPPGLDPGSHAWNPGVAGCRAGRSSG